jgi:hypothetical protein
MGPIQTAQGRKGKSPALKPTRARLDQLVHIETIIPADIDQLRHHVIIGQASVNHR